MLSKRNQILYKYYLHIGETSTNFCSKHCLHIAQIVYEVMPSSSLFEIEIEVEVEVGDEVGVEATFTTFKGGWVGWCGEVKTRANLIQV